MNNTERYNRQIRLKGFGEESQRKLLASKVLVVGAGGLGIPALQYLASMGVGTLGIVDGDVISVSNLNRQVLYNEDEAGQFKAEVLAKKLSLQNPVIKVIPLTTHLTSNNALETIKDYDLVIDATDNIPARYLINDACIILNKPFVFGAIHQYEGQVSVFNYKEGPTYRCLYPVAPRSNEIADCNEAGVLGVVPGIIGCQQALEAVKIITGIGKVLSGFVSIYDFLNNEHYKIKLKLNAENKKINKLSDSYETALCSSTRTISSAELYEWLAAGKRLSLIDVRESFEYELEHFKDAVSMPLISFKSNVANLDLQTPVVAVCQKGQRSISALEILQQQANNIEAYSLKGGLDAWLTEIGNKFVVHA